MANSSPEAQLPSREELARLSQAALVAYAARCALRAVPVLGRRGRLPEEWGMRSAEHVEAVMRAVQAALVACTARTEISAGHTVSAAGVASDAFAAYEASFGVFGAFPAASSAVAAARVVSADDAASAAAASAAAASEVAADADAVFRNVIVACRADYEHVTALSILGQGELIPVPFFARPLWTDEGVMREWTRLLHLFQATLREVGLFWLVEPFVHWTRGEFAPEELARDFNEWTERQLKAKKTTKDMGDVVRETPAQGAKDSMGEEKALEPPQPPSQPRERTSETLLNNDGTEGPDTLNRGTVVEVIAGFLRDQRTQTPLTLSVEGRWGSGKTHFMRQLRGLLDPPQGKGKSQPKRLMRTVWFNPWRHQSHEELWAAFALTVINDARSGLCWWQRLVADTQMTWQCMDQGRYWRSVARVTLSIVVFFIFLLALFSFQEAGWSPSKVGEKLSSPGFLSDLFHLPKTVGAVLLSFVSVAMWMWRKFGRALARKLELHIVRPNYAARTSFLEDFHADFLKAVTIYARGERLAVFIDDLDRCDVPRAAELMQGINLMLGDQVPLIYVLGMDRAKVAAGIAVKHRDLLPFLYAPELAQRKPEEAARELHLRGLEYGYEFIEKFIQLPFRLPPATPEVFRKFIQGRLTQPEKKTETPNQPPTRGVGGDSASAPEVREREWKQSDIQSTTGDPVVPDTAGATAGGASNPEQPAAKRRVIEWSTGDETHLEAPLLYAVRVLDGNPRRIAQLINLVRLQSRLVPVLLPEELRGVLKDGHLAKWTAVALRWPVFLVELQQESAMLTDIVYDGRGSTSPRFLRWKLEIDLWEFLRGGGPDGANPDDYRFTDGRVIKALLLLGVTVPVAEVAAATDVFKG